MRTPVSIFFRRGFILVVHSLRECFRSRSERTTVLGSPLTFLAHPGNACCGFVGTVPAPLFPAVEVLSPIKKPEAAGERGWG